MTHMEFFYDIFRLLWSLTDMTFNLVYRVLHRNQLQAYSRCFLYGRCVWMFVHVCLLMPVFVCVCSNHRKAMLCISPRTQGSGGFVPFIFDHLFNPLMLPQVFELSGKKLPFYADLATSIDACWRSSTFTLSVSAWGEAFPIKRD